MTELRKRLIVFIQNHLLAEYALVFSFFAILGLYRFSLVLFTPNMALTNYGDGLGTMSMMSSLSDLLEKKGFLVYVFSEPLVQYPFGDGLLPLFPFFSALWRMVLLPFILIGVAPQNIYDLWGFTLFILTGLSGYYLARVLGASWILALFAGLLYGGMDNFAFRLTGHMSLSSPFMLLFQVGLAITVAKHNKTVDTILLVVATWLSFQANEYYGFYGLIFTGLIFVSYALIYSKQNLASWQQRRKVFFKYFLAFSLFCLLFSITYSQIIFARLGIGSSAGAILSQFAHDPNELFVYSLINPLGLFLPELLRVKTDLGNPGEFSFRIGFAIVAAIWSFGLVLFLCSKKSLTEQVRSSDWLKPVIVFTVAALVLALFGLSPVWDVSLARIVNNIVPMFRVAARSYMLVDIGLISILIIVAATYFRLVTKNEQLSALRLPAVSLAVGLLLLVYADITRGIVPNQFTAYPLPQKAQLFTVVPADAIGSVIELPFWPPSSGPEKSYEYLYNWALHKHNLINAPFHILNKTNPTLADELESFSREVNHPDIGMINLLGRAGIRYLVANCGSMDFTYLKDLSNLKPLNSDGCTVLYEISTFNSKGKFRDLLNTYKSTFGNPDPNVKLSASDCRASISGELLTKDVTHPGGELAFRITLGNLGSKVWGDKGADVQLGAVWFKKGKEDASHNPNFGETRIPLRQKLSPGESLSMEVFVNAPGPGDYELWFSPLQPGVMWCFHVGSPPFKTNIKVTP